MQLARKGKKRVRESIKISHLPITKWAPKKASTSINSFFFFFNLFLFKLQSLNKKKLIHQLFIFVFFLLYIYLYIVNFVTWLDPLKFRQNHYSSRASFFESVAKQIFEIHRETPIGSHFCVQPHAVLQSSFNSEIWFR